LSAATTAGAETAPKKPKRQQQLDTSVAAGTGTAPMPAATATPTAPTTEPSPTEEQKKPTVEELLAQMQAEMKANNEANKQAIDLMAQAIVKLNEKIEAKPNPSEGGDATAWITVLKELAGGGKPSSLEEAAKSVGGLVKFAEEMDRFRHPFDGEGALAKRLLWRQGMRVGGIPRYMTKEELKRYDKFLDQSLGLGEEEGGEGGEEHVSES